MVFKSVLKKSELKGKIKKKLYKLCMLFFFFFFSLLLDNFSRCRWGVESLQASYIFNTWKKTKKITVWTWCWPAAGLVLARLPSKVLDAKASLFLFYLFHQHKKKKKKIPLNDLSASKSWKLWDIDINKINLRIKVGRVEEGERRAKRDDGQLQSSIWQ